ncbi:MAG TPA: methylmalonyl Co-A mutase-associated GTPase MeaB [Acidobacteriota bacterium]|nr:methylmalonyl Co-A mutase-associated GTPase MeaB [Acidobacteriota bacterium]HMZ79614.1 methylmalonyl Co-A mutase-associated GTPase MeaB [Acidobacteriota bacterium]HNH81435.1 methylmalonyl Co-A mutase-associated GTPase MeaB [Acidobacteriota bacterium]HNJ41538.1 methylmalonyl Co-A mutase-associated GTPase MeaB [Acidobacteriota bacterium]
MSTAHTLAEGILKGNIRSIARGITAVENNTPDALSLMKQIFPHTGKTTVIGLTGSPGAGKSSLVDTLAKLYRQRGEKVGILAVDPSSPFSGGAILGDRIRMQSLALDPGIYIRSMATRGNLGGLARATSDAALILDAAGYDRVIVETVGVGQDEVDIVKTADVTLVVMVPGMGDDIQSIKAGIMEIGDLFIINKSDREGVERIEKEIEAMLSLGHRPDFWQPPILKTVATRHQGLDEVIEAIASYLTFLQQHQQARQDRQARIAELKLTELLRDKLLSAARRTAATGTEWSTWASQIATRERDPYSIVEEILDRLNLSGDPKLLSK